MSARGLRNEDAVGVFEDPYIGPGGIAMQCPVCGAHSPPAWRPVEAKDSRDQHLESLSAGTGSRRQVSLDWMHCGNEECEQAIIRVHEHWTEYAASAHVPIQRQEGWIARPRFGESQRPIDPLIEEPFRTDYQEAAAILDLSHRMSAVLARKIMSDLLRKYAGRDEKYLTPQIDAFLAQPGQPSAITSGLYHVREAADMSAHTQEDQEADDGAPSVIEIDREEAEWTLDFVDRMFDHFVVQPAKDEAIKARIEDKSARAGRHPIKRPPDSEEAT